MKHASPARRRQRRREAEARGDFLAMVVLAIVSALIIGAFFYVAAAVDASHGITVSQSLRSAGL